MTKQRRVVVFTGAGVSAESGLKTFRDSDGLWEGYRIEDVATLQAWRKDPEQVLRFYNERRRNVRAAKPNAAHLAIAELEKRFEVTVITQNIDDLHERAGSTNIVHLHGEILKARSTKDEAIYPVEGDINLGDKCARGGQLRPHIVWFGEAVPMMEPAWEITARADIFIVVGTSLVVYPAAGLVEATRADAEVYLIDPRPASISRAVPVTVLAEPASTGVSKCAALLRV